VRLHRGGIPVVAGSIVNANPETLVSWANYFYEFSAWIPPGPARPLADAPTACLSVERDVFERFGPFVGGTLSSDSVFCRRLARAGQPPQFAPQVRVAHLNVTRLAPYLWRKWLHGRAFARVRAAEGGLSRARCALRVLVAPAVPVVLVFRTARAVARARAFRRAFVLSAPLVFVGQAAWALGEAVSYARLVTARNRRFN
jgi:GT2 family glycosyltransferase